MKGNVFWACAWCIHAKQPARGMKTTPAQMKPQMGNVQNPDWFDIVSHINDSATIQIGKYIHMDFGFVQGKNSSGTDTKIITSIDEYRCYPLIIECHTRHIRIMLSKTKQPPLAFVKRYMDIHGRKDAEWYVPTKEVNYLDHMLSGKPLKKQNTSWNAQLPTQHFKMHMQNALITH